MANAQEIHVSPSVLKSLSPKGRALVEQRTGRPVTEIIEEAAASSDGAGRQRQTVIHQGGTIVKDVVVGNGPLKERTIFADGTVQQRRYSPGTRITEISEEKPTIADTLTAWVGPAPSFCQPIGFLTARLERPLGPWLLRPITKRLGLVQRLTTEETNYSAQRDSFVQPPGYSEPILANARARLEDRCPREDGWRFVEERWRPSTTR